MDKNVELIEMQLTQLAQQYGTDKLEHGYMPHYALHMPDTVRAMLEIGCCQGASLRMWDAFYGLDTDIHTIDLFKDPKHLSARAARREEFITHVGDQSDIEFLSRIRERFDVIIDDGSHNSDHQVISFKHLFVNNLVSGGWYVVEDMHCCLEEFYWNNNPDIMGIGDTMLGFAEMWLRFPGKQIIECGMFEEHERDTIASLIDEMYLYDNKILFIKRR